MSITDSSTPLTTTWTEQSVVAFTSGTLSTIGDCVTEVESKLRRGALGSSTTPTLTEVQRWLIRAKQEISELRNYTWTNRYAYMTTVSGTYRYALPPDYNGGHVDLRDITNDRSLTVWEEYWFDTKYADPSEETIGEPRVATIKNLELWLVPPPDGTYQLELQYSRSGDDNTQTDFSWLPQIERFRCCDYATMEAFLSLHMFEVASIYQQKWDYGLGKAKRADGRRKWKRMRYQAISVFSEAAAKTYQDDL